MLFARCRDGGQSAFLSSGKLEAGFPSSTWQWQRSLSYAPLVRGGRSQEPRDSWDGSACLRMCVCVSVPATCVGLPFPYSADFTNVLI